MYYSSWENYPSITNYCRLAITHSPCTTIVTYTIAYGKHITNKIYMLIWRWSKRQNKLLGNRITPIKSRLELQLTRQSSERTECELQYTEKGFALVVCDFVIFPWVPVFEFFISSPRNGHISKQEHTQDKWNDRIIRSSKSRIIHTLRINQCLLKAECYGFSAIWIVALLCLYLLIIINTWTMSSRAFDDTAPKVLLFECNLGW